MNPAAVRSVYRLKYTFSHTFLLFRFNNLTTRRNGCSLARGLELKNVVVDLLIDPDRRVLSQAIITLRIKKLLLYGDTAIEVDPKKNLLEVIAHPVRLRDQLQLGRGHAVDSLRALVGHLERFHQIL